MIVSQHFGVSRDAAAMQEETLEKIIFRIRTAIGDSKQSYQHSAATPIHGTGQGSCVSPEIWLLVCSLLMDCLYKLGHGMALNDILGKRPLWQIIDGFVDDTLLLTNLLRTSIDRNDIETLTSQLQHDMLALKDLLEAPGGKLEQTKCFYYILTWPFDPKGNPVPTTIAEQRETTAQISVTDTYTNDIIHIAQK
jgi:hypothetical protein